METGLGRVFVRWINDQQGVVGIWTERLLTDEEQRWLLGIVARRGDIQRVVVENKEVRVWYKLWGPKISEVAWRRDQRKQATVGPGRRDELEWRTREFFFLLEPVTSS